MNALFGLHLQISVGENLIVGTAVRNNFYCPEFYSVLLCAYTSYLHS